MKKIIYGYKMLMTYLGILGLAGFIACVLIQVIAGTSPDSSQLDGGGRPLPVYLYGSVCGECGCDIG